MKNKVLFALLLLGCVSANAQELTAVGAEVAANADGSIPAWNGGLEVTGTDLSDPYASESTLLRITPANYPAHKDHLTDGQIAMLQRYPDSYFINVYPTHRTAKLPESVQEAARYNARHAKLSSDGNGVEGYRGYYPFPEPNNGVEAVWNHFMRYRGGSLVRDQLQVITQANGSFSEVRIKEEVTWPENLDGYDVVEDKNVMLYARQAVLAPSRLAGNILLVHETVNQVQQPRLAWMYNAGQRRVRRAPQVAYDGPGTAADGLRTSDNADMYSGSPDRYDWTLQGKQEIYIPYNNFRLADETLSVADVASKGHVNQDLTRYEKHRVWKVVGTLKPGMRHIYSKRVLYLDEDTWQIALAEQYDNRGELWRFSEGFHVQFYYADTPWYAGEAIYDLNSSRYLIYGLLVDAQHPIKFGDRTAKSEYQPAALRRMGVK
ncbi:DUF1329 domain-containing protein [Pseudomonas zhanjiangensis]|uniref:DUF1329 domain-containing protein n=1 Tax=Pseudomonas zhanjiangensis TaxID=3239015 RepID=A0ABV3YMW3_9PSED